MPNASFAHTWPARGLIAGVASVLLAVSCSASNGANEPGGEAARAAELAASPIIKEAFAAIEAMNESNIETLIEITQIPAPPFGEEARGADFKARIEALGVEDVSFDEVGNVIARLPGTKGERTVAIAAHLDTVFPIQTDVTVRREGETFFAPGIGDNSRGLVVLLSLIEIMQQYGLRTEADILFIGTVGEEGLGNLRGVRHLFRPDGPRIDSFIAVDGGEIERLVTGAVGSIRYRATYVGPGGHSYGAFGRAHPHQALAHAIDRFTEAGGALVAGEPKATFSVGRIGGGTSVNSIPFESWMEVDMRSIDPDKLAALDAALREALAAALEHENARRAEGEPLTLKLEQIGLRPPGPGDPEWPIRRNALAAMQALGIAPEERASSTDANIPISRGVPALTISRGGVSKNSHAPDESWTNEDAHLGIQLALLLLLLEAGPDGG